MELVNTIELILNKKALISYEPMQLGDVILTAANNQKLTKEISFEPATSLKGGLEVFCFWLKEILSENNNIF
jgi:UDP-glucuronate 4-epimerase